MRLSDRVINGILIEYPDRKSISSGTFFLKFILFLSGKFRRRDRFSEYFYRLPNESGNRLVGRRTHKSKLTGGVHCHQMIIFHRLARRTTKTDRRGLLIPICPLPEVPEIGSHTRFSHRWGRMVSFICRTVPDSFRCRLKMR